MRHALDLCHVPPFNSLGHRSEGQQEEQGEAQRPSEHGIPSSRHCRARRRVGTRGRCVCLCGKPVSDPTRPEGLWKPPARRRGVPVPEMTSLLPSSGSVARLSRVWGLSLAGCLAPG
jgi:hypothetical protein